MSGNPTYRDLAKLQTLFKQFRQLLQLRVFGLGSDEDGVPGLVLQVERWHLAVHLATDEPPHLIEVSVGPRARVLRSLAVRSDC
jgi:hypothetical protein